MARAKQSRDFVLADASTGETIAVYDNIQVARKARKKFNREAAPRSAKLLAVTSYGYTYQAFFNGDKLYRWKRVVRPGDPDEALRAERAARKVEKMKATRLKKKCFAASGLNAEGEPLRRDYQGRLY